MASTTLVGDLIAQGREVVTHLEQAGIDVDIALWLQDEDSGDWRLVVASPYVDRHGPRPVYERLVEILTTMHVPDLRLGDVRLLGVRDSFVRELKRLVGTNEGLHDIRLDHLAIGGQTFRSARIYRVSGGSLENDARVRVRENGRLGTVRGVFPTPQGQRYLVMYDLRPEDLRPLGPESPSWVGRDFSEDELEFLYVVRTGG
jgi:hypothetical protein